MARRSDHTREELAALVVSAARDIVAGEGPAGVTMRRLAKAIGYAVGSIYNAVGDQGAVLLRVNAATLAALAARLDAAVSAAGPGRMAAPLAMAVAYMGFVTEHRLLWAALLENPPQAGAAVPEWYAAPRTRLIDLGAEALAPFYPDPAARRRAVVALWAALQGVAALAAGGNFAFASTDLDSTDIARSIVTRYLTGREDAAGTG